MHRFLECFQGHASKRFYQCSSIFIILRASGSLNYWAKWRLGPEEPPPKSGVSLPTTTVTGLSIDVHRVFGEPDRGCMATSCFRYFDVPSDQRSLPSFQMTFYLTTVFFGFVLLLIPNMLLSLHYAVRVHLKSLTDGSVRECDEVCWSHLSIHFLMAQQSPRMKPHVQIYFIIIIIIKTTHSWLLWDFLHLFAGSFLGRCFFNGFRLTKSKKRACICIMKLRYNYLVNLLL